MRAADLSPQQLAEASARAMWADDNASQQLGMRLDHVAPGAATLSMTITAAMANGHGNCHGGYIFTLADSAFAFGCNGYNQLTVAQHAAITYLAPVSVGDRLTAVCTEVQRRGRGGVYDVSISNQSGDLVAVFRGNARTVKGTHLPG